MVSGRGLGHTGGTLDKLDRIPGFRVELDLGRSGGCSRTARARPDRPDGRDRPGRQEAVRLRDATATVESIP
jgi:thymidine phosphorylase